MSDLEFNQTIKLKFADVDDYLAAWNYLYITGAPFDYNRSDLTLRSTHVNSVDIELLTKFHESELMTIVKS